MKRGGDRLKSLLSPSSSMRPALLIPLFLVIAASALAGCTGTQPGTPAGGMGSSGGGALAIGPTATLPPEQAVEIQINEKDPIYATITAVFAGGKGQIAVKDILVRVTTSEGKVTEQHLEPLKGSEVKFQGTKGDDRIEVIVTLNTGAAYKVIDRMVPYRTRG